MVSFHAPNMVRVRVLKSQVCTILEPREVSVLSELGINGVSDHTCHLSLIMERTSTWKEKDFYAQSPGARD